MKGTLINLQSMGPCVCVCFSFIFGPHFIGTVFYTNAAKDEPCQYSDCCKKCQFLAQEAEFFSLLHRKLSDFLYIWCSFLTLQFLGGRS